jgi:hypothetical protein
MPSWSNLMKRFAPAATPTPLPVRVEPQGVTGQLGRMADDATAALARGMKNMSKSLQERPTPVGLAGTTSLVVARTLDRAGKYLERKGCRGALEEVGGAIKKNPLPYVAVGIGLAFLAGRATKSRA